MQGATGWGCHPGLQALFATHSNMTNCLQYLQVRVGACDAADASKAYTEAFDANR